MFQKIKIKWNELFNIVKNTFIEVYKSTKKKLYNNNEILFYLEKTNLFLTKDSSAIDNLDPKILYKIFYSLHKKKYLKKEYIKEKINLDLDNPEEFLKNGVVRSNYKNK